MIRLDSTLRKLQIVLAAATTTAALPVVVCWADKTATAYTGSTTTSLSNGVTSVDIVAAPAASTVRDIDFISIFNADTVPATVSVIYNDNTVTSILTKMTLASGSALKYTHASGWQSIDKNGGQTATASNLTGPISSLSGVTSITAQTGTGTTFVVQTSPTLITPVLGVATGTSLSLANGTLTSLTVTGTGAGVPLISAVLNGVGSVAFIDSYSGGAIATNHNVAFRAARGTAGTPTASQTDDRLGWFNFRGYGATAFAGTARAGLSSYAAENWTDTAQGTYFSALVTAVGSTVMSERMRVDGIGTRIAGFLTVGSITAGAAQIDINSGATAASWTTNGIGLAARANTYIDSSTAASGTAATNHIYAFAAPTLAATNTLVTTTNAATVYIAGAPIAGANETITSSWALLVNSGNVRFNGSLSVINTLNLASFTVATLPAGVQGDTAYVTNALAPAYNTAVAGGGTVIVPVFRNATVWVCA